MKRKQLTLGDFCESSPTEKRVKIQNHLKKENSNTGSSTQPLLESKVKEIYLINDEKSGSQVKYIPNFLTKQESSKLFNILLKTCEFEKGKFKIFGKEIISKRQISSFGDCDYEPLFKEENYSKHHRRPTHEDWPQELIDLKERIEKHTGENFTFALINRYDDGESAIGWHSDQERDIKKDSSIVSISLGAERDFKFRPIPKKETKETTKEKKTDSSSHSEGNEGKTTKKKKESILKIDEENEEEEKETMITQKLENGSMVVMNYATQIHYQHSIPKRRNVNSIRLNITFRHVVRNKV